jgi:hypothetical protein
VIEGQLKYLIGDKTETVGPGARMIIPRGVIHGFTNVGVGDARHILVSTPRRHEEFFRDLHNIPEPREQHRDQLPAIAQRHDQAVVGPLPWRQTWRAFPDHQLRTGNGGEDPEISERLQNRIYGYAP